MNHRKARDLSLKLFIAFLGITALVAIVCVLGGEFGELEVKILLTSLTISAASICAMSCAAFMGKRKLVELGFVGIGLAMVSAALVILGMWSEISAAGFWKTTITCIVLAVGLAHVLLLLMPELDASQRWVQPVVALAIAVLALQIIVAVVAEIDEESYYQFLAAVAILVGLGTLVIPILMRLRKGTAAREDSLVLSRVAGDVWRDRSGREFRVTRIDADPD